MCRLFLCPPLQLDPLRPLGVEVCQLRSGTHMFMTLFAVNAWRSVLQSVGSLYG
jgi:hypothetical protein